MEKRALPLINKLNKRALVIGYILAALMSISFVWGYCIEKTGHLSVGSPWFYLGTVLLLLVLGPVIGVILDRVSIRVTAPVPFTKKNFWLIFGILVLCYLPVFLAVYPGFFCYDATDEYVEVATRVFTTHHPLLHVLLLGGTILGVHKITDSYNAGIACFTLLQMIFLSGCFSLQIGRLYRKGIGKWLRVLSICFLGLFPTVVMFVLCSVKDTLFSAFLLLSVLLLEQLQEPLQESQEKGERLRTQLLLGTCLTGMSLLRHNAWYALIVFTVLLGIALLVRRFKGWIRGAIIPCIVGILLTTVLSGAMTMALHADASENQELLTVPIQQLARTWNEDANSFSQNEQEILTAVLPREVLVHYTPNLSDPVKYAFRNEAYERHKGEFWKMWIRVGVAHPVSYVNAWLNTCYGYFYPLAENNVYEGHEMYTFTYDKSSYFAFETEPPGERMSLISPLEELYRQISLEIPWEKVPVIGLFFSMGFWFWIYLLVAGRLLLKRRYGTLWCLALPGLIWLTLLLGPTYLPRYTAFLWFMIPETISFLGEKIEK